MKRPADCERVLPFVISAGQARMYNLCFGEARILVDGECSGGSCWMGVFRQDPGFVTPLHLHPNTDEYLFVIDGVLSVYITGKWYDLEGGSVAVVPHGAPHAQCNAGKQSTRLFGFGNPAGFEHFFAAQHELLGRLSPSAPQYFSEMAKLLRGYDTEVIAPPPARP